MAHVGARSTNMIAKRWWYYCKVRVSSKYNLFGRIGDQERPSVQAKGRYASRHRRRKTVQSCYLERRDEEKTKTERGKKAQLASEDIKK
ncbi:hypothetical protein OsI_07382 [Oryza sativa Indica Group]|uniref:Uncharacterized protein n=3 Tax=Oryza TaxID=4527 RepID=A3A7B1_ORYSJ|nr:hypothetical protein OsI_07382 [Oryza sativa Indica Group]EAZ23200.1 hypothetical protein OsJ_06885 [Oryza sativa Japonica Group]